MCLQEMYLRLPASFVSFFALLLLSGCTININGLSTIVGNGNVVTQQRTLGMFTSIASSISGTVDVICKSTNAGLIEVEADENLLPFIKTEVVGSSLRIFTDNVHLSSPRRFAIRVYAGMIDSYTTTGSGNNTVTSLDTPQFTGSLSGSGLLSLTGTMSTVALTVSGSGELRCSGTAQTVSATLSSSGMVNCRNLLAQQATALLSGSGSMLIFASQSLEATVSGSGTLLYFGNPPLVRRVISGSGIIRPGT
jgi:hypothetical protein